MSLHLPGVGFNKRAQPQANPPVHLAQRLDVQSTAPTVVTEEPAIIFVADNCHAATPNVFVAHASLQKEQTEYLLVTVHHCGVMCHCCRRLPVPPKHCLQGELVGCVYRAASAEALAL